MLTEPSIPIRSSIPVRQAPYRLHILIWNGDEGNRVTGPPVLIELRMELFGVLRGLSHVN